MKTGFDNLHWTAKTTILFLLKHMVAGMIGGCLFGGLVLYFDVSKLWTMISSTSDGWLYTIMLFTSLCLTFGSIGMGWGIFSLAQERDDPPDDHMYY